MTQRTQDNVIRRIVYALNILVNSKMTLWMMDCPLISEEQLDGLFHEHSLEHRR